MRKFLSAYSYFFQRGGYAESILAPMKNAGKLSKRIRKMRGKYLSVYGEYGECRVVCGTQNRL
jgi:hypothetical protein